MTFQQGMLAVVAARLRAGQGGAEDVGGEVVMSEDGEAIVVDDNCTVSFGPCWCHHSVDANRRVDYVTRRMSEVFRY